MVDSGFLATWGELDYQIVFREMIDLAMPRQARALVHLSKTRPNPSSIQLEGQVTNTSDLTLAAATNGAAAHFIVFIGHRAMHTGREILAVDYQPFDEPLAPGETRRLSFGVEGLRGVNLSQADALLIVDYQPKPETGRWDMLQAAAASNDALPTIPTALPTATPIPSDTPTPEPTPEPTEVIVEPDPIYLPAALHVAELGV